MPGFINAPSFTCSQHQTTKGKKYQHVAEIYLFLPQLVLSCAFKEIQAHGHFLGSVTGWQTLSANHSLLLGQSVASSEQGEKNAL